MGEREKGREREDYLQCGSWGSTGSVPSTFNHEPSHWPNISSVFLSNAYVMATLKSKAQLRGGKPDCCRYMPGLR